MFNTFNFARKVFCMRPDGGRIQYTYPFFLRLYILKTVTYLLAKNILYLALLSLIIMEILNPIKSYINEEKRRK